MDRRRVNGPETSVTPIFKSSTKATILNGSSKRIDNRSADDLRPLFLKTGLVTQANGSAYIEMGKIKIVCAVYGPRQLKRVGFSSQGTLTCDFKFSSFSCVQRRNHMRDPQEREYSTILVQALTPAVRLELIPKSAVDIYINVLESDGDNACLAAAIIVASVALADAGIEMLDQVTACSALMQEKMLLMDGTMEEEDQTDGSVMVSYMPSLNEVTSVLQTGKTNLDEVNHAMESCIDGCSKLYGVMSASLIESLQ
ncbi:ribosomal protein S5 domain 2-like protein [Hesseltinella vesiculosa]|uniref:Ribosomal protein S5 domain 2-like protein n=1 Tax=Hesseltinella vesiculosa TaxID=101127 RepID=A0A1X2G9Z2_9FUNG|nr:ribosomal protein S5 domain 2-like protein [Hesseltinella vesiculosa]